MTTDQFYVSSASMRTAVCNDAPVTWIQNSSGTTLPQELASTGHHIMHKHDGLPEWLEAKLKNKT